MVTTNRLFKHYKNIVRKNFIIKFNYKNIMNVPKIKKINLYIRTDYLNKKEDIAKAGVALELITGVKPIAFKANTSIPSKNIRKNQIIAWGVNLHQNNIFIFLDKLITILRNNPYLIKKQVYASNNSFALQIPNATFFPNISHNYIDVKSINISFITTTKNFKELDFLLGSLGYPFKI